MSFNKAAQGLQMGLDIRQIQKGSADYLPDRLRHAGFTVNVSLKAHHRFPGVILTRISCQRGEDVQHLFWEPDLQKSDEYRITILNSWSWWKSVRARQILLRNDVIAVIEQSGGYFPSSKPA